MPLINCEIILQLKWTAKYFLSSGTVANQVPKLIKNDTNLYVPVVTLSTKTKMQNCLNN